MKNMKTIIITLVMVFCVAITNAQKKSTAQKAKEKIEVMNQQIMSVDASLALNEEQQKALVNLQVLKLEEVKKINDAGLSEEETKIKLKEIYKKGYKELSAVMSKEQLAAFKEGKKKK